MLKFEIPRSLRLPRDDRPGSRTGEALRITGTRITYFGFGLFCHGMFLAVFLYMAGFVGDLLVPKSIDSPADGTSAGAALAINVLLLAQFALPHSVMARPAFKRWWTRLVPHPNERSVYVLVANLSMILLMWQWWPLGPVVWDVQHPPCRSRA